MPTFGDYETTGEPLASTAGPGHSSQIWLARKTDAADDRLYALKTYTPRQTRRARQSAETMLEEDRALEFLEGVKQIKKAQSEGGKAGARLQPVHQFGKTPEGNGAWYVTDLYGEPEPFLPRSLQSFIIRGGRLDGHALRNIVHNVAAGCIALQRSRGFSHGNLKSGNVFRAGKTRTLRKALLQLADAFPAAPVQLASLDPSYRESVGELLQQTMEAQDLRAIGVLILQLVEGRLITTDREYDYPARSSPAWERLGKDAQRWLEVCNRLLDPSLSLERVNLQALEKEFRPGAVNAPMIAALAALICMLFVGGYFYHGWRNKQNNLQAQPQARTQPIGGTAPPVQPAQPGRQADFKVQLQAAQKSFDSATNASVTNLIAALDHVNNALALAPSEPEAARLRQKIVAAIGAAFADALRKGNQAVGQTNLDEAVRQRGIAGLFQPGDRRVGELSSNIFKTALFAATNAVEGSTVNLDEAERHWKFLQEIDPANAETDHVKSLIEAFDTQISEAANADQAVINGGLRTMADATNLINAVNGTGVFAWRPSDTNATGKLMEQLQQKRTSGIDSSFDGAVSALKNNNVQEARNWLEILRVLAPSDARVPTLESKINSAAAK